MAHTNEMRSEELKTKGERRGCLIMVNKPTKQGNVKTGRGGQMPPKERQFGQPNGNPRHNGAWKKEDTPRFKLEQMMKMTEQELLEIYDNKEAPYFERKLARAINQGDWKVIESMINQVYGQPKQSVETIDLTPPKPLSPRKQKK